MQQTAHCYYGETTARVDFIPGHPLLHSLYIPLHAIYNFALQTAKAHHKSPNFYEAPHPLTTPSLSTTCHAKLQTLPHPIMHSAADYGSLFSPKMCCSFCNWVCLRSDCVLTTNKQLQGSFERVPRPLLRGGLGTLVWSSFGAHPSATAAFSPAQTNLTKRENEL